jgi:putative SOS response-associated peptidase YedK
MCGRFVQASAPRRLALIPDVQLPDSRHSNWPPRYNGAPSQDFLLIRRNPQSGERSLDLLRWGLIPNWSREAGRGRKPINAKAETVATLATFREAHTRRRAILPMDSFYEWRAAGGAKQAYAIAMKDRAPFGLAALWENWREPNTGQWLRTFTIITVPANGLLRDIHPRMPAILAPRDYERWIGPEPDPRDALRTYPGELMVVWPISTRVNSHNNDDEQLLEPAELAAK